MANIHSKLNDLLHDSHELAEDIKRVLDDHSSLDRDQVAHIKGLAFRIQAAMDDYAKLCNGRG